MSSIRSALFALAAVTCAFSQSFECAALGNLPNDPSLSCESVASNNLGFGSGVTASGACAFPTAGSQYAVLMANGGVTVAANGPLPRPASTNATELRVPIPAGATSVAMSWEFFNAEGGAQLNYNDGMSADVVDSLGNVVANLFYADTHSPLNAGVTCGPAGEIAPAGPQSLLVGLPVMSACDYVSIVVWNGGDNAVASRAFIDGIVFNSSLPPSCGVPCVPVVGTPALSCTSPFGPGSLQVDMSSLPANGTYVLAVTLTPGTYPNGWFYGIDISVQDLGNEINAGFPFSGPVSGGCAAGAASIGPFAGAPSGLTLYMVALGLPGNGLNSAVSAVTNSIAYTIP